MLRKLKDKIDAVSYAFNDEWFAFKTVTLNLQKPEKQEDNQAEPSSVSDNL